MWPGVTWPASGCRNYVGYHTDPFIKMRWTRTCLLKDNEVSHSAATVILLLSRSAQTLNTQDLKNPTPHHRASLPFMESYFLRVCSPCLNLPAMQQNNHTAAYTVDVGDQPYEPSVSLSVSYTCTYAHMYRTTLWKWPGFVLCGRSLEAASAAALSVFPWKLW